MPISIVDKKPLAAFTSDLTSPAKLHEPVFERSLNRRLGIRDLPMPPVPSDADDDADEDENDGFSEQAVRKEEDDLCDSIVKAYFRHLRSSRSPTEVSQQPQDEYVLMLICLQNWLKLSYVAVCTFRRYWCVSCLLYTSPSPRDS